MSAPHFRLMASEDERLEAWRLFGEYGLRRVQMYALADPQPSEWLAMTANGKCDLWLADGWGVYYLTWSNGGLTPEAHFAVWPERRKDAQTFFCAAINDAFNKYPFKAAVGITPAKYRHVFPVMEAAGFEIIGTLPQFISVRGKPADAVLSIIRRP